MLAYRLDVLLNILSSRLRHRFDVKANYDPGRFVRRPSMTSNIEKRSLWEVIQVDEKRASRSSGCWVWQEDGLPLLSCCQIYSAVSTALRGQSFAVTVSLEGSDVDTAIWTKPCGDLAGQLLYGDSLQCSNFVPTPTSTCAEKF
jgi:hypothetical protein